MPIPACPQPQPHTRLTWHFVRQTLTCASWSSAVLIVGVLAYACLLAVTPERVLTGLAKKPALALRHDYSGVRLFQDNYDRDLLIGYGAWLQLKRVPYLGVESEYPQVATYLFGIPHLFGDGRPRKRLAFSIMGLGFLLVLAAATRLLLAMLGKPAAHAACLYLPASLYFAANRHDVFAAALVAISLLLLFDARHCAAMVFLSFAILTKWYPAVLAPFYLAYVYRRSRRLPWLPALTCAGVLALFMAQTLCWAGIDGLLAPYRFQLKTSINAESFYGMLRWPGAPGWLKALSWSPAFLVLQFAAVPLALFLRIRTEQQLLETLALATVTFMLFGTVHSPQWLLWLNPILILAARTKTDLAAIAAYDLLTFVYFPLGYDLYDGTIVFRAILLLHGALRLLILYRSAARVAAIASNGE